MTKICLSKSHNKPQKEVDALIQSLQTDLSNKYGLSSERLGNQVSFKGSGVNGTLTTEENLVKIDITLGMMMSMLASTIEPAIKSKLDKYLND